LAKVLPIVPFIIYAVFFTRGRNNGGNVPGAADNLSACALAVAMGALSLSSGLILTDSNTETIRRNGLRITIRSLAEWLLESE